MFSREIQILDDCDLFLIKNIERLKTVSILFVHDPFLIRPFFGREHRSKILIKYSAVKQFIYTLIILIF